MLLVLRCSRIYFDTAFTNLHCWNTFRPSNKWSILWQCLGYKSQLVFCLSFTFRALPFHRYLTSSVGSHSMVWRIFCCHWFIAAPWKEHKTVNFFKANIFLPVVMFPFLCLAHAGLAFICCFSSWHLAMLGLQFRA